MLVYIFAGCGAAAAAAAFLWKRKLASSGSDSKPSRRLRALSSVLLVIGLWTFAVMMLRIIFGTMPAEDFTVELWAERVAIGSYSLSTTVIITWIIMAVVLLAAIALRIFVIPKMTDVPKGLQNVLELCVEGISKYTRSNVGDLGDGLPAYMFTVAVFMVSCAAVELFGYRAPTADITMTFALSLITFFLINYYGIRRKGLKGRIKALAQPTPVVFPMKIISDVAIPVSLACRLFGNMLGGMIVMDLLYNAMKGLAVGVPSVLGLYFNLFHPLIQTFIFITLSLTFINEAVE